MVVPVVKIVNASARYREQVIKWRVSVSSIQIPKSNELMSIPYVASGFF